VTVALVGLIAAAVGCGGGSPEQAKGAIVWTHDYEAGMATAREAAKPVMVDVFATWCAPCKRLDEEVFSRADVAMASQDFVTIRVDGDEHPDTKEKLGVSGYPTVLFLTPEGEEIGRSVGAVSYNVMLTEMQKAKERYAAGS
jgi:thiol:disulfide interchange protein